MNKPKLFFDMDGVILNTIKAITDLYNQDFSQCAGYKPVHWTEVESWNMEELTLMSKKQLYKYFDDIRFFEIVEFMENAEEVINELNEHFDITVVTIGSKQNLYYKERMIFEYFTNVKFIGCEKDKSHVDMSNSIFIEDRSDNLRNSNANVKIIYGDDYEWNKDWDGLRFYNWEEIKDYLQMYNIRRN